MNKQPFQTMSWDHFKSRFLSVETQGFALDTSRMKYPDGFFEHMQPRIDAAFEAMAELENGAIANPDEGRMVGHYWLRDPETAPSPDIKRAIEDTQREILAFADAVHSATVSGTGGSFTHLLVIGIGGSALGPQFVHQALGHPKRDRLKVHFFDNTDPDGIDLVLDQLNGVLDRTLTIVISKSGGTPETRNGMIEAQHAYRAAGVEFNAHAVAVTGEGSALDHRAEEEGWLRRFPMWDWVGGRTSEFSAVGLLPAALQGIDIEELLAGAGVMDRLTRTRNPRKNPAAMLALSWYNATAGKGEKDMVVLPYKDRLLLFSKYLQQLVMESLGKAHDLDGQIVHQGISVYGNKGSTDQHSYVQQLRDGVHNFFVVFVEVLRDRAGSSTEVEEGSTSGDFLQAFYLGTREALFENGRESISLVVDDVTPHSIGQLIALFERAVGFYASLIYVNAYHQPGVEAGKKAASSILALKKRVQRFLEANPGKASTVDQIASSIDAEGDEETIFKLLEHAAANPDRGIRKSAGKTPFDATYQCEKVSRSAHSQN